MVLWYYNPLGIAHLNAIAVMAGFFIIRGGENKEDYVAPVDDFFPQLNSLVRTLVEKRKTIEQKSGLSFEKDEIVRDKDCIHQPNEEKEDSFDQDDSSIDQGILKLGPVDNQEKGTVDNLVGKEVVSKSILEVTSILEIN